MNIRTQLAFVLPLSFSFAACQKNDVSTVKVTNGVESSQYYPEMPKLTISTPDGEGTCSGTFVSATEYLTAAHCVGENKKLSIDGVESLNYVRHPNYVEATKTTAGRADLAIVKFPEGTAKAIGSFADASLQGGEFAAVVGYGTNDNVYETGDGTQRYGETTVNSVGNVIRAEGRSDPGVGDARDSSSGPGDSGGALINKNGKIVGVVQSGYVDDNDRDQAVYENPYARENYEFLAENLSLQTNLPNLAFSSDDKNEVGVPVKSSSSANAAIAPTALQPVGETFPNADYLQSQSSGGIGNEASAYTNNSNYSNSGSATPTYDNSSYTTPTYDNSSYTTPTYDNSNYSAPTYNDSSSAAPTNYSDPAY